MTQKMTVEQFAERARAIVDRLEDLNYFKLLGVPEQTSRNAVRAAYQEKSRHYHPDKYLHFDHPTLVADLHTLSKRLSEAYLVLRDDRKRAAYLDQLQQGDSTRFDRKSFENKEKQSSHTQLGATPKVQKMVAQAQVLFQQGKIEKAVAALKMAMMFEANSPALKALLAEWEIAASKA